MIVTVAVVGSVSGVVVKPFPFKLPLLKSQIVSMCLLSFFDLLFFMALMFDIKAIGGLVPGKVYYAGRQMRYVES